MVVSKFFGIGRNPPNLSTAQFTTQGSRTLYGYTQLYGYGAVTRAQHSSGTALCRNGCRNRRFVRNGIIDGQEQAGDETRRGDEHEEE